MRTTIAVTAGAILFAAVILWGIGRVVLRYCRITADINLLAIGVGLSAVITIGGLLNALQLAYAPALWSMVALGVVVGALELRQIRFDVAHLRSIPIMVFPASLLIAAAVLFAISTQVPPRAFNHFDDLQKYFAYPVRMLATGTLSGSPLNSLGHSTFGGMAFLQAFVLSLLPIQYLSTVDSVFGLTVLLGIGAAVGWRLAPSSITVFAIPLTILMIEPQYINVSGVYLPCVLMLTAFILVTGHDSRASPILLGVIYTSLVTLKATFALFVVIHFLLAFIVVLFATRAWRQSAFWVLRVAVGAFFSVLPWVVTFRKEYELWGANQSVETLSGAGPLPNFLSTAPLYWGGSYAAYSLIAAVCALSAILCLRQALDHGREHQSLLLGAFAAASSGPMCYLLLILVFGPLVLGHESSLRYSIPMLTAAIVPALGVMPRIFGGLPPEAAWGLVSAACLAIVLAFTSSFEGRISQAWNYRSVLSFPETAQNPRFLRLIDAALSDQTKDTVRRLQAKVPPSEPLLAQTSTPFHLDYGRNPIIDVAGTSAHVSPWSHVPANVRYVLWQFNGFGVRHVNESHAMMESYDLLVQLDAKQSYRFTQRLERMASDSKTRVIEQDGSYVLFAIERMPD